MFDTPADLLRAIRAGEDSFLELKQVRREGRRLVIGGEGEAGTAIAKWLCCFANTDGGVIVFGVSDDESEMGLADVAMDDLQQLVVNAARNNCEPPLDHLLLLDAVDLGAEAPVVILKVEVLRGQQVHAPRGQRPSVRVGNTSREASMEHLGRLFERRGPSLPFEEWPVARATVDDLDGSKVGRYFQTRFGGPPDDAERAARNLRITAVDGAGETRPTVVGLLMFGRAPTMHLGSTRVELTHYAGVIPDADRQIDTRRFEGSVVDQLDSVLTYLAGSAATSTAARKDGFGRTDRPRYELRALQEAVVNAVAHRDYQLRGAPVHVFIFDDRIEVASPGRLPNSLTPTDLFGGALPFRRNQLLAGFLRDYVSPITERAYMESRGEGFLTMVRLSEQLSGRRPQLVEQTEALTITIFAAS